MEPTKQKEVLASLLKQETEMAISEILDRETYCFLENSPMIDREIDIKNYKWVRPGDTEANNIYPFKGWKLQEFFEELSHEVDTLFLGFNFDTNFEKLVLCACKVLKFICRVRPRDGEHLRKNWEFLKLIEGFKGLAPPFFEENSDLAYVTNCYPSNMLTSVSRYIEGLIYSKVSGKSFQLIINNPFRETKNPYKGIEMLYTILAGSKLFEKVRKIRLPTADLEKIAKEDNCKISMSDLLDKMYLEAVTNQDKSEGKKE